VVFLNALSKLIFNEVILAVLENKIIPQINIRDWEENKNEIIEQFIGAGIEAGVWVN
jgi:hypothetical protein